MPQPVNCTDAWETSGLQRTERRRGNEPQLLIDNLIVRYCKRGHTNQSMTWAVCLTAYDMISHSWIRRIMEMYGVEENMRILMWNSMKYWRTELTGGKQALGEMKIKCGIFQGHSVPPWYSCWENSPWMKYYTKQIWGRGKGKLNHLLLTDGWKLFTKTEAEMKNLVRSLRFFSICIKMCCEGDETRKACQAWSDEMMKEIQSQFNCK